MIVRCVATLLPAILLVSSSWADGVFTVAGRDILLDGTEFEVKGVCYQPAAIGENPSASYPYGDYFYTDANSSGIDEQYPARWARDFANFEKLGLNVIRIYGWDPNQDHGAFLSMAAERGIYVLINRWINPGTDFTDASASPGYQPSPAVTAYAAEWSAIATEAADHPAVMGFLIGNETNAGDPPNFFEAVNHLAGIVKGIAPHKLVSTAITERLDQVAAHDATVTHLDFWAVQSYRGYSFGTLFDDYAAASGKPLVITETGHDALDGRTDTEWPNNAEMAAIAVASLWNDLRTDDAGADISSGALVFSYADEWWKDTGAGQASRHNYGPRWPGYFIDGQLNEEWWGIFRTIDNGDAVDLLEPRALFHMLAALWNEPHEVKVEASHSGGVLELQMACPAHLRAQRLLVEASPDLVAWTTVAHNAFSTDLRPAVGSANITTMENGDMLQTIMRYNIAGASATSPLPVLFNGDFEIGWPVGWFTSGSAVADFAQGGSGYSLKLDGSGGFSNPSAYQELAAAAGDAFKLSGWMLTPAALPPNGTDGLLKIVFRDAQGNELVPASVSIGHLNTSFPGAESLPKLTESSTPGVWHFTEAQAVAPPGTTSVRFYAIHVDESAATIHFDSIAAGFLPPVGPAGPWLYFRVVNAGL